MSCREWTQMNRKGGLLSDGFIRVRLIRYGSVQQELFHNAFFQDDIRIQRGFSGRDDRIGLL